MSLDHLLVLKLKRNQITQLKDGAFYGLLSIVKLWVGHISKTALGKFYIWRVLDYNNVQVISKGWLYGLKALKGLSLSHNNMNTIEDDAWEFCQHLEDL